MTTPVLASPVAELAAASPKRKRVLLVDASAAKRDLRAEIMRKLGIEVDCAADISEARSWWRASLYNLVLMNVDDESGCRDRFCEEIRSASPPQQLAFLVGKPDYLAAEPKATEEPFLPPDPDQSHWGDVKAALTGGQEDLRQRWGILEASRRISAVRSLSHARSRAQQERPAPPRDVENSHVRRTTAWSQVQPQLLKEKME
jgi:CheY-like chemotaxis protein